MTAIQIRCRHKNNNSGINLCLIVLITIALFTIGVGLSHAEKHGVGGLVARLVCKPNNADMVFKNDALGKTVYCVQLDDGETFAIRITKLIDDMEEEITAYLRRRKGNPVKEITKNITSRGYIQVP